jgi:hypothetical protein
MTDAEPPHVPDRTSTAKQSWRRFVGPSTLAVTFILALGTAVTAYLYNVPFGAEELVVVCGVYYVLVFVTRWLWAAGVTRERQSHE